MTVTAVAPGSHLLNIRWRQPRSWFGTKRCCDRVAQGRALFRYVATREDIVLQDGYDPMITEAVRARPATSLC
jgi:hypothetical protein